MIAPVKDTAGYLTKLAIWTSLQNSLVAHNAAGGTYTVATPWYIYTGCILQSITDTTGGEGKQTQIMAQWDFVQPLTTQMQAIQAYSSLMSKLASGAQVTAPTTAGTSIWSNAAVAVGSAAQNAVSNISNLSGVVNKYLSTPL